MFGGSIAPRCKASRKLHLHPEANGDGEDKVENTFPLASTSTGDSVFYESKCLGACCWLIVGICGDDGSWRVTDRFCTGDAGDRMAACPKRERTEKDEGSQWAFAHGSPNGHPKGTTISLMVVCALSFGFVWFPCPLALTSSHAMHWPNSFLCIVACFCHRLMNHERTLNNHIVSSLLIGSHLDSLYALSRPGFAS